MLDENINIKTDKDGKKYIENSREYIKEKLKISINTITNIYKELSKVGLIKVLWIEVGKPNILYIKDYEVKEKEETHNNNETVKIENAHNEHRKEKIYINEFSYKDYLEAEEFINKIDLKKVNLEYHKCLKKISFYSYGKIEEDMIKIALKYITGVKQKGKIEKLIKYVDNEIIKNAVSDCKNHERMEHTKVIRILINYILYELNFLYESKN